MEQKYVDEGLEGIKETNLEKLKQLFPSCIKDGQVDFEELKNMLGEFEEVDKETYEFNWVGKQNAKQIAINGISGKTLKLIPEDSKNIETTQNIYIEGDNLEVLKLLKNNYANSIKMIYIDPPYNTGNDFVYNDNFDKTSENSDEDLGNTIDGEKQTNINKDQYARNSKEADKYHSNWLNMMYPRLKLAQELLTEDGVIFISIDNNEQANLKKICDEIFEKENFIANMPRKTVEHIRVLADYELQTLNDYVLVYCKNINLVRFNKKVVGKMEYEHTDKLGKYTLKAFQNSGAAGTRKARPNLYYPIYFNPKTLELSLEKNSEQEIEVLPKKVMGGDGRWLWSKEKFVQDNKNLEFKNSTIFRKCYYDEQEDQTVYQAEKTWLDEYPNRLGAKALNELGLNGFFDYSKPVELINLLLKISSENQHLILDFFAGSSTTAHAVMKLNSEDGGNRKYIMVQIPEVCESESEAYKAGYKNICEIGKERIRRAGEKIKQELIEKSKQQTIVDDNAVDPEKLDIGFKVFRVDDTNINWESKEYKENFDKHVMNKGFGEYFDKEKLTSDFVEGAKDIDIVYELLLRYYNVPLTEKISVLSNIGSRTYSIGGTIIVCLEDEINKEIIDKLSNIEFAKLYLRDSSFKGNNALELKENLMIRLNLQKGFKDNETYKVEFI